jgi:hypothetical protein
MAFLTVNCTKALAFLKLVYQGWKAEIPVNYFFLG